MGNPKILIVDDEEDMRDTLRDRLEMHGYEVVAAADGMEALEKVEKESPELVLLDIRLPRLSGMKVLSRIKREHPEMLVIMITAYMTVQRAIEAIIEQGAYDFIEKPFNPDLVRIKVDKALERQMLMRENEYLRGELIGESEKMAEVHRTIQRVAPLDSTILITGESGTGKELVARALHRRSLRSSKPLVVVNCSAMQPTLVEDELFGHDRGAFTGAEAQRPGKMELADGGTLFLDEIGDMAYELQAKLLRAIQEKEFERLGGRRPIKVDVRFIGATNRDIEDAVQEGKFRQDLFYRLNVVRIHVPPLRERREDIPRLVEHFVRKYSADLKRRDIQITRESMELLTDYHWPGNVRELQNYMERTIQLADSNVIRPEHLPQEVRPEVRPIEQHESAESGISIEPGTTWKDIEKAVMLMTYRAAGENKTKAARVLEMSRRAFVDKWKKYKLDMHVRTPTRASKNEDELP